MLARYNRLRGRRVFFLTGTDEHGQKVEKAAAARGKSPKEHADDMVKNFQGLWKELNISNDAFIRTTDREHIKTVQELLQKLWDKGLIERRTYSGWYCTPDERFWTEKDLINGHCPECGREVERIEEQNFFFLMSRYQDTLINYIEKNPGCILPDTRRNEVLGFLKSQPLGDLCISRPKKRLAWGIPLPFDEEFVTYVWFDALVNYYSALGYLAPETNWWPADVHIIGKDILTTHAVYWSAMLMALEMELPGCIFAHGWWTVDGQKMSKSRGNVVHPGETARKYGVDAFRYFLLREIPFGLDGDFSEDAIITRVNTELANDLGNLTTRTFTMIKKYFGGKIPQAEMEPEMKALAFGIPDRIEDALDVLQFNKCLEEVWKLVSFTNKYIESNAPWALAKSGDMERLGTVLYSSLEALRLLAIFLYPFMPASMAALWKELGLAETIENLNFDEAVKGAGLIAGTEIGEFKALFPRIEKEKKITKEIEKKMEPKSPESPELVREPAAEENLINIEDFAKVELKVGKILEAERVQGSNKLIKLQVDTGEKRQVVAGIGKAYAPEDLIGKTIVVVTNLKPAKLMGVESRGMLLAATGPDGTLSVLTLHREVAPGSRIK